MNITKETQLEVTIAEGATVGLDKLREQVMAEIEQDKNNDGGSDEEEKL